MSNKISLTRVRRAIKFLLTLNSLIVLIIICNSQFNQNIYGCTNKDVKYCLEVIHRSNQEILLSVEINPGDLFSLEYKNSRDFNPVIDIFKVSERGLFLLIEERFPWYGVGQEYHASKNIYYVNNWVVVKVDRKLKKLPLRVAYTVQQLLKAKGQEYLLNNLVEGGEPIDILISVKGG